ncbi:carbohydrate ABC transporter permease [Murimonas intestini]|uniref:Aldouronate transport system permease protein n=1 Tax=Murimonas intestini TaxID=1337051 RepID=A0AB73T591_9FIRM|nr:carbohydrate ABC transporter permease [Murimonas intestini]MCR1842129.1 carbohydrate ABC transporter permease [Murimonas intestini]MCR1864865.1 carbohydrate ABC transporter permease [Murimonas intestini]MCR1884193.1 carbohydrate ABC transporter permease [Murimonas intestini]
MKKRKHISLFDAVVWLILIISAASCLFPILNTVAISFSDKTSALTGKVGLIPKNFTLAAYEALVQETQFFRSFLNSVVRVILGTAINMFLSVMMAYPLSKDKTAFPSRNIYMWIVVFTMLFSGGLIPTFLLINQLKLMDTIWALVLPGAVPVFSVIILMNFFKGIPKGLEEAAAMDGASPWYIMWRIFVPLAKPAIATIALFAIVNHWNAFFDGKIYINSPEKLPLQTYIQSLTADTSRRYANMTYDQILRQQQLSTLTFNSAKIVVSMIPILAIYPFLQKYFVSGIVMGAVKE